MCYLGIVTRGGWTGVLGKCPVSDLSFESGCLGCSELVGLWHSPLSGGVWSDLGLFGLFRHLLWVSSLFAIPCVELVVWAFFTGVGPFCGFLLAI